MPCAKFRRAIQRIDVPAIVGAGIAARAFFATRSCSGQRERQALNNQVFRSTIGRGHQIDVALVLNDYAPGKNVPSAMRRPRAQSLSTSGK